MHLGWIAAFLIAGLFLGMLLFSEVGRRVGIAWLAHDPEGLAKGSAAAEGAVFALLGLLIAFTFSGAASRFDDRRLTITEEANAIGTAYLRVDLLPGDDQVPLRDLFRRYVEVRSTIYRNVADRTATNARLAEGAALQGAIWTRAVTACGRPETPAQVSLLLLPALNEMIDITTTRETQTRIHPPAIVYLLLVGLSFMGAVLVGYATSLNRRRSWFHTLMFAGVLTLTVYVIVDLEFPRVGLVRIDAADQVLVDLRKSMP